MQLDLASLPKNVPREFLELFRDCGYNVRAYERLRKVNRYYVYQLVKKGDEPTDRTKKGREARIALFLSAYKKRKTPDVPDYVKKWRALPTEERRKVIKQYITWKEKHGSTS